MEKQADTYRQKTLGEYPIPRDVSYASLSPEDLEKLDAWTDRACRVTALRCCQKTGPDVEFDEAYNYLLMERHKIRGRISSNDVEKHNVCNYFQQGIWNKGIGFIQKYWDDLSVRRDIEKQSAEHFRLAGNGYEGGETQRIIRIIKRAADMLGIIIDSEDLVASAKEVISEGVHKGRLTGRLFSEVNDIAVMMSLVHYENRSKKVARQGSGRGKVRKAVRKAVEENPSASAARIHTIIGSEITKSRETVSIYVSEARRDLGLPGWKKGGSSLLWTMYDLFKEGITEINPMKDRLNEMRIPFRPSYVGRILRAFNNGYKPGDGTIRNVRVGKKEE